MLPAVFVLLLPLATQWLLVTANPTGAMTTTTTVGMAADATSTTPEAALKTGVRTVLIAVTDSVVAEQDGFTVILDAPTTYPHIHSSEGGIVNETSSALTDAPATTSKEEGVVDVNSTGVVDVNSTSVVDVNSTIATPDQDSDTVGLTTVTTDPLLLTTYWDTFNGSTTDISEDQNSTTIMSSELNTSLPTTTTSPVTVTTTALPKITEPPPVCPNGCECEHLEVHCSRAGLVAFPERLHLDTTYLDVGHNYLTAIADDELANLGLTKLTSLICDNNTIETVGRYAFRGLIDLALLQLSGNRIRTLSTFVFVGNSDLRHIDLTGNPLSFGYGPLLSIQQLEWLEVDQCNISLLSLDAFRDMRGLRYLNMNGNRISYLAKDHFYGLNYLRYIKLVGNPLPCDCNIKAVWNMLRQQTVHVDAKCIVPDDGSTESWNFLELLKC